MGLVLMFNNKTKNFIAISDAFEIVSGGTPKRKQPEFWGGNIPWISIKDFNDSGKYILNTEEFITKKGLKKSSTNVLYENDIIISARGTVGKINLIRDTMAFNQSCYGLRANNKINPIFGYYALKNSVRLLLSRAYGSVFSTITIRTFNEVKIPFFDKITQENIANLLSSLDDKIENNNAIIANLEAQAQTIFKSWFVDFEPFQDLGFVESELGEIPVNWSIISLKEVSAITMGQSPKSENYNIEGMGYPFMQGNAAFGGKFGRIEKYTTKANKHAEVKDILLSVRAPVGDMNINIFPQLAIGRGLSSIRPNDNLYGYIYYYLNYYINKIIAKGTGTVFSSINKNDLEEFPILLPNTDIQLEKFNGLVETILDHQINLFKQNKKLAEIRDSLLPKLMSGEIRVEEAITEE